jgi:hypothetical protein
VWHDFSVPDTPAIGRLRQLAARQKQLAVQQKQVDGEINAETEEALRNGEFMEDIADALGVSREKIRRFRISKGIPDPRETRRAMGAPARRPSA